MTAVQISQAAELSCTLLAVN